ncbi:hypothetical protein ZYGR_0N01330 [Zygosaccharomyces rouxii]|uniref:ZYRO0D03454p n=2 Tax=Zygosaccharomyces rouxii TaxID=4956 RepID=C5DV31_ZYGRC|nr:uncharacterized protein ZYRO0D03454g [Zygosaccharomyces rouxii]KAH9200564.1 hypothetical protein LQ764DRAFT_96660 [Zygosaccharomyces rouxii]GAV48729.1 hypothetical protein ZYGR_0N01330 [Zygosaccharomyces rouxii]CAR27650.1 ZYRO0D03454p [Zygosaccharomyces rouxii]
MSLFRSLQHQPRVITLFTHSLQQNSSQRILESLRANTSGKFKFELESKFPTLDQLRYMQSVNPTILSTQVPNVKSVLAKPSHDPLFQSELEKCVKGGQWNPNSSMWVDWEQQRMGNERYEW